MFPMARAQPTYRVADLTNPILKPWAVEQMKKANDEVLAGKVPFIARERCWPAGVPGFTVYTRGQPIYFLQTPKEVVIINELNAADAAYLSERAAFGASRSRHGTANRSAITKATSWWSTRSGSTTRPSSTITARRTPTRSTSSSASR